MIVDNSTVIGLFWSAVRELGQIHRQYAAIHFRTYHSPRNPKSCALCEKE